MNKTYKTSYISVRSGYATVMGMFSVGIKGGPSSNNHMFLNDSHHVKSAPHYIVTFSREIRMGREVMWLKRLSQIVLSACRPIHGAATQSIAEQCTSDGLPWVGNGDKLTSVSPWKDLCSFRQKFSFRFPFIAEQWVSNPQHHHKPSVSHRCQCFLWQFRGEELHGFHITAGKGGVCFSHRHQTVSKHTLWNVIIIWSMGFNRTKKILHFYETCHQDAWFINVNWPYLLFNASERNISAHYIKDNVRSAGCYH